METKAVIFDLGDVFIDVDHPSARHKLRNHCIAPSGFVDDLAGGLRLLHRFEHGELSTPQFYEAVCEHGRLSMDLESFCAIYCDIFTPVEAMIEANAALRKAGLPTYIFSNTSELHFTHISRRYAFMSEFTGHVLSYEIGCMKPHAPAYEAVEQRTGYGGERLLYIDDRLENVEAGLARGWQAIHHTSPELTLASLQRLGLL